MKNKKVVVLLITSLSIILLLGFFVSKYIYFNIQEDIYFTDGRTYDGEVQYVYYQPQKRDINNFKDVEYFIPKEYSKIKIKLPYNSEIDSIYSKPVDGALLIGTIKNKQSKRVALNFEKRADLTKQIKKELISIDNHIDTTSSFNTYKLIYNYTPNLSLMTDNYKAIKKDVRLSALKALNSVNGADKAIYEFENNTFKGFQFCIPDKCKNIFVRLFDKNNNELVLIFKNFTQDEIDFTLNSIEWESKEPLNSVIVNE